MSRCQLVGGRGRQDQGPAGQDQRGVVIPIGKPLADRIAVLPRTEAGKILTNSRGEAWTSSEFRTSYGKAFDLAGITDDLHFHDLRGTAVTRMALAGCTVPQIAAVTGHSPKNVDDILRQHYLGGQIELAEQAIRRLKRRGNPRLICKPNCKPPGM